MKEHHTFLLSFDMGVSHCRRITWGGGGGKKNQNKKVQNGFKLNFVLIN
jgi:hypothetical protein